MRLLFYFVLGACFGSFSYCFACDWAVGNLFLNRRSACDYCQQILAPLDLIPILSYVKRWGHCRYCGQSISSKHLIVELYSALYFSLLASQYQGEYLVLLIYLQIILQLMAIIDMVAYWAPDLLQALFFLGPCYLYFRGCLIFDVGIAWILLILLLLYYFADDCLGGADIKLMLSLACLLGCLNYYRLILIASIIGILAYFFYYCKQEVHAVPFIPCLMLAFNLLLLI